MYTVQLATRNGRPRRMTAQSPRPGQKRRASGLAHLQISLLRTQEVISFVNRQLTHPLGGSRRKGPPPLNECACKKPRHNEAHEVMMTLRPTTLNDPEGPIGSSAT